MFNFVGGNSAKQQFKYHNMANSTFFSYPSGGDSCANMMSMLAPLIQRSGIDPNLVALMNNGGMGGNNGWWLIFVLLLWGRNGFNGYNDGSVSVPQMLTNSEGREFLMQAINGNTSAINSLASTVNCDINSVKGVLNTIQSAICNVSNQTGMGFAQVTNAITNGDMQLMNQLASCCCDVKQLVTTQGYENRINNIEQTNTITKGFGDIAYATQSQTTALAANQDANTRAVLAKIDQVQDEAKNNEIANLRAQVATLTATAQRQVENQANFNPVYARLAEIEKHLPQTVTIPYSPVVGVPACSAFNAMYGNYPFGGRSGQIWS